MRNRTESIQGESRAACLGFSSVGAAGAHPDQSLVSRRRGHLAKVGDSSAVSGEKKYRECHCLAFSKPLNLQLGAWTEFSQSVNVFY